MGANEKHAATYHGVRHDPDLNLIRTVYAGASPVPSYDERAEAVDRMIAKVRAEAKAEALREAAEGIRNMTLDDNPTDWLTDFAEQYKGESTHGR